MMGDPICRECANRDVATTMVLVDGILSETEISFCIEKRIQVEPDRCHPCSRYKPIVDEPEERTFIVEVHATRTYEIDARSVNEALKIAYDRSFIDVGGDREAYIVGER